MSGTACGPVRFINLSPFDVCLAGFPCQAFSLAGRRMGFQNSYKGDCRGTLFQDVVRICEYRKPQVIFCENVKGLTIHDRGRTFKVIKGAFEELGYTVFDKVLNSRDFGVPQNRERIYIVCFRKDIDASGFRFPEPTNGVASFWGDSDYTGYAESAAEDFVVRENADSNLSRSG